MDKLRIMQKVAYSQLYLCIKITTMGHHEEPEQNEIGGPVTFALFLFAIVVITISMLA